MKSKAVKVGIFLVGGLVLFCAGLFLIGSRAQLFGNHFTVYTKFSDINSIQTGAMVRVSGMNAGQLTGIEVPKTPSSKFLLKMTVDREFRPIIRRDSVATIETQGMVGNEFINIKIGTANSPECPPGCTLPSQEAASIGELMRAGGKLAQTMQSTIEDVRHRADSALGNIDGASSRVNNLIAAMSPKILAMTNNADAIVAGVRHGQGAAGKLLTDKAVAADVQATVSNAKQTTANMVQASRKVNAMASEIRQKDLPALHQTMQNAQDMSQQLNQAVGTFLSTGNNKEGTAVALRDAAHGFDETANNLADDTEAIKTNFFFRGFFKRRGFYNLSTLTPEKYEATDFVKQPRVRLWIPASELFKTGRNGSQALTSAGRARLDQAMSALVPYLPDNPIMIEGYSTSGVPDQQYLASRQRALEVRNYLDAHFHLNPDRVGAMPLADRPPEETGKQKWDGVCLVLVVSKTFHPGLF